MRLWPLALLVAAGSAGAEPRRVVVEMPPESFQAAGSPVTYLYLNRCSGGCPIVGGSNDASSNASAIPAPGSYTVAEFVNGNGDSGTAADADWAGIVKCMQEVYSPYAITVSDQ